MGVTVKPRGFTVKSRGFTVKPSGFIVNGSIMRYTIFASEESNEEIRGPNHIYPLLRTPFTNKTNVSIVPLNRTPNFVYKAFFCHANGLYYPFQVVTPTW